MKQLASIFILIFLVASCTTKHEYFKFTFTDQLSPKGIIPEYYELNSDGKLIILTNKFNDLDEHYGRTYFIELTQNQLDSAYNLVLAINALQTYALDNSQAYLCRFDCFEQNIHYSGYTITDSTNLHMTNLLNYCSQLLSRNKRYKLNHSYYFNTSELCHTKPL